MEKISCQQSIISTAENKLFVQQMFISLTLRKLRLFKSKGKYVKTKQKQKNHENKKSKIAYL